jgi:hypothetical protein
VKKIATKKFPAIGFNDSTIFKMVRKRVKKTESVTVQVTNFGADKIASKAEIIAVIDGLVHISGRSAANKEKS